MNWYKLSQQINSISEKWKQQGVDVSLYESDDKIYLQNIIVPKDARKQGVGTAVMEDLVNYADQVGKRIELTVGLKDKYHGTTSRGRLVKFYKRFGFVENKGRNKDYTTRESMYREPIVRNESIDKPLDFQNIHIDFHNEQHDYILAAIDINMPPISDYNGTPVGIIEYSIFQDEIYINNMLVKPERRREGIATQMMNKLKEFNSGLKINWGMTTPEGNKFQQNYEKIMN